MLNVFRDNLKKLAWILWLVIAVFILLVFVDFGGAGFQGPTDTGATATVDGEPITVREFRRQYERSERQAQALYGEAWSPTLARALRLGDQALDTLIAQRILLAEADRLGLAATKDDVREAILDLPGFQDENGAFIGQDQYTRILRANSYDVADFEKEIHDQLLLDKLNAILMDNAWASDQETLEAYREQVAKASIRYLQVTSETFVDQVTAEPEEMQQYYAENSSDFSRPEQRVVDYLLIEPALLADTVEVGEDQLRAYYDQNIAEFSTEEQVRARHILLTADDAPGTAAAAASIEELKARIAAGEDFADLARELSADDATRDNGGELGFFARGRYNPDLEEAAFAAPVGELVGPIESDLITQTGIHLIEVLDRREGGAQSLDEVSPLIRSRLVSEGAQQAAAALAQQLHARIESESLSGTAGLQTLAASNEAASLNTTEPFTRDDNVPGIGRGTSFTASAFLLELGQFSAPVALVRGQAILHVADVLEPRIPELAEIEDQVRAEVVRVKSGEAAAAALTDGAVRVRDGLSLDELAAELGVEVAQSDELGPTGFVAELGRGPEITEAAFELDIGTVGGPFETDSGSALISVVERTDVDPVEFEDKKSETRAELSRQRLDSMLRSLIEERKLELDVQYNQPLLDSLGVFDAPDLSS
jgi:peptidyl-prolyl cis-trans isomerase D